MPALRRVEDPEDTVPDDRLLADMAGLVGMACLDCGQALCGHEALGSIALGLKNAPRCLPCLSRGLDKPLLELRAELAEYVQARDCYRRAWEVACDREGLPQSFCPPCLNGSVDVVPVPAHQPGSARREDRSDHVLAVWDAGAMGCGDLVLALRGRLQSLPPGAALQVMAQDPAAPVDLPAWCRLTGNRLVRADHPVYIIRRKES